MSIPEGVVYRSFARETVVLNLATGQYHGLNPTAARMLDTLAESPSVAAAAAALADVYKRSVEDIERDLFNLCTALLERELILVAEDESEMEPEGSQSGHRE